jgi:hypothetical protein
MMVRSKCSNQRPDTLMQDRLPPARRNPLATHGRTIHWVIRDLPDQGRRSYLSAVTRWSQPVDATLYLKGEMECAVMGQRFHRGFTAAEKTELWDRWKRGESLKAIGRAFGKPSSSIYFLVAPHGGIRPAQRRRSRLVLTLAEREVISSRWLSCLAAHPQR